VTDVLIPGIRRDIAAGLQADEARFLVDAYYSIQDFRIQATGQVRSIVQEADEGSGAVSAWLGVSMENCEKEIRKALDAYSLAHTAGRWSQSITGIGPVIAAGLLAHIDIEKAPTVGHIWRFAGLDPTVRWEKKTKRPWNASLKVLCWKLGDSFVKQSSRESDVYGKIYRARKELEVQRNEEGLFADQAAASLTEKKFRESDTKKAYEAGRLPPGRLDLRARRYAVKLFLSAYHEVAYFDRFGELPPKPYVIEHLGHVHYRGVPNMQLVPGLREAHAARSRS
jgi:hypothetical protein